MFCGRTRSDTVSPPRSSRFQREEVECGDDSASSRRADPLLAGAALHPLEQTQNLLHRSVVETLVIVFDREEG